MTTGPRPVTPQDQARMQAMKRNFEQRRHISERMGQIRYRLAVYSGKGGVGKTTIAANLAVTLAQQGSKVGILDADIDCPNMPQVLKMTEPPEYRDGVIKPSERFGVKLVSTGLFQENPEEAIIFRGPMIHNSLNQLMEQTDWGELDYLVIDMPPGTSDAALTVMQTLTPDGFLVVVTPQELAKLDAKRSINMMRKMNVRVLGVVENFCGPVFGYGAGEELAMELGIPFLGRMELRADYQDTSKPAVLLSEAVKGEYLRMVMNLKPLVQSAPQRTVVRGS